MTPSHSEEKPESSRRPSGPMLPSWCYLCKLTSSDCHQLSCCSPVKVASPGGLSTEKAFHYCPVHLECSPSRHPRGGLPHSSGLLTIHVSFLDACCVHAKLLQGVRLCVTPWTIPPGPSVHGILQASILEWVAMPFSRGSSRLRDRTHIPYISYIGSWVLCH